jgi:23S rRNA (pseudouridine1915-N3)-methyltransferase
MRIRLISEGRIKNPQLRTLQEDYLARLKHFTDLSIEEAHRARGTRRTQVSRRDERLTPSERRLSDKVADSYTVLLDAAGRHLTSAEFAAWLDERSSRGTRELAFLVGSPEGFSTAFKARADLCLALSRMTLTRDWALVLLLEQIYRGFTILRGYPYAK